jgi:hypothetical protein
MSAIYCLCSGHPLFPLRLNGLGDGCQGVQCPAQGTWLDKGKCGTCCQHPGELVSAEQYCFVHSLAPA